MQKGAWKKGFGRRLSYFIIGLVLGTILIYIIFGDRIFAWLPENRIKNEISTKVIVIPDDLVKSIEELGISPSSLSNFIENSDVDYSASINELGVYPQVYVFQNHNAPKKRVQFTLFDKSYISILRPLQPNQTAYLPDTLTGWGEMYKLPREEQLVFIEKTDYIKCKSSLLPSDDADSIVASLKVSGRINFNKSNFNQVPAVQYVTFEQGSQLINAKTELFRYKIMIKDFYWDQELPCEEKYK